MKKNLKLSVKVQRNPSRGGRHKTLSSVFVWDGERVVARRLIPGIWRNANARDEFYRFPERWTWEKGCEWAEFVRQGILKAA